MNAITTTQDRLARMSTREIMLDAQRIRDIRTHLIAALAALDEPAPARAVKDSLTAAGDAAQMYTRAAS